jgi:hypothetical protein
VEVRVLPVTFVSIALSLIAQAPAPAVAPAPTPVSLTLSIGRGRTWDDEGEIGRGTSVGGGVEWRFRPKWSAGAEVERLGHHRDAGPLEWSGRTIFASANIIYRFAGRGITPYVGGGFGGAFHDGETISRFAQAPLTIERSSSSPMEYATAGVEIPIAARFALSPEFRIVVCQPPDDSAPWAAMRFAFKGSWRF